MDAIALRNEFSTFVGDEKYRAFVELLNRAPISLKRLRFWQQELWDSFVQANPHWPTDFGLAREAFRVCQLHGHSLILDTVCAPAAQIRRTETQSPDMRRPHTPMEFFYDFPYPGWGVDPANYPDSSDTRLMETWYCPECRRLRSAWEAENGSIF
jgi:hypothetical protein